MRNLWKASRRMVALLSEGDMTAGAVLVAEKKTTFKRADEKRVYVCTHGATCNMKPRPDLGDGWVQPFASACRLDHGFENGAAGVPFKPGVPGV